MDTERVMVAKDDSGEMLDTMPEFGMYTLELEEVTKSAKKMNE